MTLADGSDTRENMRRGTFPLPGKPSILGTNLEVVPGHSCLVVINQFFPILKTKIFSFHFI